VLKFKNNGELGILDRAATGATTMEEAARRVVHSIESARKGSR
jgi:hypothetical protein